MRNAVAVLADCKEEERMREVFAEHRPAVVFHAAAYKHVGMMEEQPGRGRAQQRARHADRRQHRRRARASGRFVLVSTDKAVEPGDRHGRLQGARRVGGRGGRRAASRTTRYASVRFGNVLGSSGSVVPIFRRQIAAGGPVTVTDPSDDALLHDDPGGGPADHPVRLARATAARSSCSTWASRCGSSSSRGT